MGFAHRAFVAAGVGFAASMIVGCGGSGNGSLLSGAQANNLTAQLNRVTQALDSQNCAAAQQYLQNFRTSVENMGGVNSTLVNNLTQGVVTVESLANRDCRTVTTTPRKTHTRTQATTTTTATDTTTTFTNPTTSYTQPTYTQPTDTTTTSTTTSSTTGGGCLNCLPTTTDTTTTTGTTSSTTTPSGGGGLGGADTTSTTTSTAGAGTGTGF